MLESVTKCYMSIKGLVAADPDQVILCTLVTGGTVLGSRADGCSQLFVLAAYSKSLQNK
jgi:hypothetical protein